MNRLFGRAKPKEPGPSITDCIAGVNIFYNIIFSTKQLCLGYNILCFMSLN